MYRPFLIIIQYDLAKVEETRWIKMTAGSFNSVIHNIEISGNLMKIAIQLFTSGRQAVMLHCAVARLTHGNKPAQTWNSSGRNGHF